MIQRMLILKNIVFYIDNACFQEINDSLKIIILSLQMFIFSAIGGSVFADNFEKPDIGWQENTYPIVLWEPVKYGNSATKNNMNMDENRIILKKSIKNHYFTHVFKNYDSVKSWKGRIIIVLKDYNCSDINNYRILHDSFVELRPNDTKNISIKISFDKYKDIENSDKMYELVTFYYENSIEDWLQITPMPYTERIKKDRSKVFSPLTIYFGEEHYLRVKERIKNNKNPRNFNSLNRQNTFLKSIQLISKKGKTYKSCQ